MHPIGIEFISVLGEPPVDYVHTAAELGVTHIGMAPAPIVTGEDLYPAWSLVSDPQLRRAFVAAVRDRGLTVSQGEGFLVWPDRDMRTFEAEVDAMAEIGAPTLNAVAIDPDAARCADQLAVFAEMAGERGLGATVEFVPGTPVGDLAAAVALVRKVGRPNFKVLVDTMHLFRTGSTVADFAALDPALVGYVQLCDVPLVSRHSAYADEARFDRLAPGDGELPLREFIAAVPDGLVLGLEVPMLAKAEAGIGPLGRLRPAVEATRLLLEGVEV